MQTRLHEPNDDVGEGSGKVSAVWAMGDNLLRSDTIAIDGLATIIYKSHWGEVGEVSTQVEDPTYRDLFYACNELIINSTDEHHVFIEDIIHVRDNIWELCTGS